MIKLNTSYARDFINETEYEEMIVKGNQMLKTLLAHEGLGNDFLGWIKLPEELNEEYLNELVNTSLEIQKQSEVLVVIGIGGSYLGAKAVLEALNPTFETNGTEVIFAGHNMSGTYLEELLAYLKHKDFSVNVISKSGTTTEPAIAFRLIKKLLIEKYGHEANKRIYVTTDQARGALKSQADSNGYKAFIIPDDVGGRFSVFTAVGLLPISVSGIDIFKLVSGAKQAFQEQKLENSEAVKYAAMRNVLYNKGYVVEMLINYEPKMSYLSEWWKQLYGESEGKDQKGIFPASAIFSTDLHSLGQYIQDGRRMIFETVIEFVNDDAVIQVEKETDDSDGLNYLAGKKVSEVNNTALKATIMAHVNGGVPNLVINLSKNNALNIGYLLYFFELSCAVSGYLLGVNPFNQPGVESYKKNMFALLDKPGYEDIKKKLLK